MTTPNQRQDLELLKRIKVGQDRSAKEELVTKYLPMVKHIVKRKYRPGYEFEDLIQEGLISLLKAIDNYNGHQYQVKFSTFAYICVLRKMLNVQKHYASVKHQFNTNTLSLCGQGAGEESRSLMDVIDDQAAMDPQELVIQKANLRRLNEVLRVYLTKIEYVVFWLYLQGMNCGEIGEQLGLDSKVVDNAKTRARRKLQKIIHQYGSLSNPQIPLRARKRADLAMEVNVI
ncbi:MAG TPA: sigma-70 family RNA polymerase sigma factor [Firmicutes bacterium]|uniref:Sigma-70 family RNA polymerase sigma factor n=1 Tax=Capillibacterium thermochitinicola TaxID=2699427 RepID=A0A8J6LLV5_9FIRM|nr:sigma-70 family RNA polymerase sigma factor [Capillibacterium thermochitinicola]HHW11677.1 sigma-70 family RNA polymerase sigma factor [Bacillota bacterium]